MMADTASPATRRPVKSASRVLTARGSGVSRQAIGRVHFQNPIQSREHQQNGAFVGERAARKPGPGTARHEGDAQSGEQPHDRDQLFTRTGKYDEIGKAAMGGQTVHRVRQPFSPSFSNVSNANDGGEIASEAGGRR